MLIHAVSFFILRTPTVGTSAEVLEILDPEPVQAGDAAAFASAKWRNAIKCNQHQAMVLVIRI